MNKYNHPPFHDYGLPNRRSIRLKGYDYAQAGWYFITICCQDRICRFGDIRETPNGRPEMVLNELGQIAHDEWLKLPERFPNFEMDVFQIMPNHMHGIIRLIHYPVVVGAGFTPAPTTKINPVHNSPKAGFTPAQINGQSNVYAGESNINPTEPNLNPTKPFTNLGQPQGIAPAQINGQSNVNAGESNVNPTEPNLNPAKPFTNLRQPQGIAPTVSDIVGAYKSLVSNGCLDVFKSENKTMGKLWQRNYYEHIIRNEKSHQTIANYIINNPAKWLADKFYKSEKMK